MSYQDYIIDVKKGKILTCQWVKLAIKRHEDDLKKSKKDESYPFYFDDTEPKKIIKFASILQHWEGDFAGKPIIFEPWQEFIIYSLYGWRRKSDGTRRFKKAFVFVARKNGKTLMASVLMLYHLFLENGAQVYSIATRKDQAKIAYNNVVQFIQRNPKLKELVKIYYSVVLYEKTASKIEALSSDSDLMDGLNPSFVLADEVSAYKTSRLIDVMQSGMYSRKDPMMFEITTGNDSINNIGFFEFERSQKVLQRIVEDDAFFCMLYTLDKEDSWKDSAKYIKANPNLGVTLKLETLIERRDEAQVAPYKEQEFKIKNLNLFENVAMSWISDRKAIKAIESWRKYDLGKRDFSSIPCILAVDLSKRLDFTSMTLAWYLEDIDKYVTKHYLYIPESQIEQKMKKDSPLIRSWISQGLITATPGETIDYSYLVKDLKDAIEKYNIVEGYYDRNLSGIFEHLVNEEQLNINLADIEQRPIIMGPLTTEYETIVVSEKLCDYNSVWRWMLSNAKIKIGGTGLAHIEKIDDRKDSRRIDAVITSIMAIGKLKEYLQERAPREYVPVGDLVY